MKKLLTYESFFSNIFKKKKINSVDISALKDDVEYLIQSFIDDNPNIKIEIEEASIKLEDNKIKRPKFDIIASGSVLGDGEPNIKFVGEKNCIALQIFSTIHTARQFINNKEDTIESMNMGYEIFSSTLAKVWIIFWRKV